MIPRRQFRSWNVSSTTYPHVPTFSNYLSIAYLAAGDQEKATALVREAYRRHPQYLFAKVNYANLCLQQGEIGKVPGIFDHACDLQQLYPHRTAVSCLRIHRLCLGHVSIFLCHR